MAKTINIALVGNPNSGKSSLFNVLTGMNQSVGNFPGVTVDKKVGSTRISHELTATVIDLPGTYSLYPRREDEWVAYRVLMEQDKDIKADVVVLIADASNLKRNLLFVSQIIDLKLPVVVGLSMLDIAKQKDVEIDVTELERELGVPVVPINPRKNKGIAQLRKAIEQTALHLYKAPVRDFINNEGLATEAVGNLKTLLPLSDYQAIHYLINHESFTLDHALQQKIEHIEVSNKFNHTRVQAEEILQRYQRIDGIIKQSVSEPSPMQRKLFTDKLDDILLHRRWGYLILLAVLFLLFQSVFWLAEYPMDWIDSGFAKLNSFLSSVFS